MFAVFFCFRWLLLQLPLSLLNVATGSPLLVELKGGDTYNGRLVSCDSWMNMNLRDVICTSKDGDQFWKLPSCYIRGSAIKYLRLPPDLLEKAKDQGANEPQQHQGRGGRGFRGGRGGRGGRRGTSHFYSCIPFSWRCTPEACCLTIFVFMFQDEMEEVEDVAVAAVAGLRIGR